MVFVSRIMECLLRNVVFSALTELALSAYRSVDIRDDLGQATPTSTLHTTSNLAIEPEVT